MSCTSPLYRLDEKYVKFLPVSVKSVNGGLIFGRDIYDQYIVGNRLLSNNVQKVPCNQCASCRLDSSRQWANRCMLESEFYPSNVFITLTYDDDHLPYLKDCFDLQKNEFHDFCPTLVKRDYVLFLKRLRKDLSKYGYDNIRFFLCGEYGSKNHRPHYHAILFNCDFPDKRVAPQFSTPDNILYVSDILSKCWPKGISTIGNCTWQSCAYVARYIMKKQKGKSYLNFFNQVSSWNSENGTDFKIQEREFIQMSRMPGLARQAFDTKFKEIYEFDKIIVSSDKGFVTSLPPRYFDRLYDSLDPSLVSVGLESLKEQRIKRAKSINKSKESRLQLSEHEYNELLDRSVNRKLEKLTRQI